MIVISDRYGWSGRTWKRYQQVLVGSLRFGSQPTGVCRSDIDRGLEWVERVTISIYTNLKSSAGVGIYNTFFAT